MRSDDTGADGRLQSLAHQAPWAGSLHHPGPEPNQGPQTAPQGAATPWLRDLPATNPSTAPQTGARRAAPSLGAMEDLAWPEAKTDRDPPEALTPSALSFSPEEEQELAKGLLLVVLR